jgi:hypothetical protein
MYVAVFVEDDYPKQEVIFISGANPQNTLLFV